MAAARLARQRQAVDLSWLELTKPERAKLWGEYCAAAVKAKVRHRGDLWISPDRVPADYRGEPFETHA